MDRLEVGATEILIDEGLPDPILPPKEERGRVAILTQPAPTDIALRLARQLETSGVVAEVVGLPDREAAKTLDVASSVYDVLAKFGLTRQDTVLGVGGGSVTDLAGFVAGTWMRGVESVLVPTTLLGAVDAAIGGKTGVNVSGKNLVGVFWHPTRVAIDIRQLGRLPSFLIRDGLSEAFKAGLVGDPSLVGQITTHGLATPLSVVVPAAINVKTRLVSVDATEDNVRAFLNFGHTVGHALEYASTLSHGEAISLGMVAASRISERRLGFAGRAMVADTLARMGLPVSVDGLNRDRIVDLLQRDKKRDTQGLRMVLLREIGEPTVEYVSPSEVEDGLEAIGFGDG